MIDFDALRAEFPRDRIHWRAQTVTKDGTKAMALAYLDARDVRQRLNDVVGTANWSCDHYDCGGGKLGCRLAIRIGDEWVSKTDGAGETAVEAEKGAFSAALKRAGVAWGIGEYLYDLPAPWVPCETHNGKFRKFTDDPWKYVRGAAAPQKPAPEPSRACHDLLASLDEGRTFEELEKWRDDNKAAVTALEAHEQTRVIAKWQAKATEAKERKAA